MSGKIIKGIASFYYVKAGDTIYECSARGIFRKKSISPVIGDNVEILIQHKDSLRGGYQIASIENILPRKNNMVRPPVANVDQAIIVVAANHPKPNLDLLDRLLILVQEQGIDACICINKVDTDEDEEYLKIKDIYEKIGYPVIATSAIKNIGIDPLRGFLKDKTSFLAGSSGVGKSTLLNTVDTAFHLETGGLSEKIQRGKHTTRHVELMPLAGGGYVLDTPGFGSVSIEHLEAKDLKDYYIEFDAYEGMCKFKGCSHIHEPGCKVKQALEEHLIDKRRYDNYINMYNQLKDIRRW
ncbi:MAG TPA: ribosome small subunit-dependent GTPase A [Epulopiscium sp.]|nr:ribosome small subunit-dependent GTPase A [Candidatus Epulonipiscium sp.]